MIAASRKSLIAALSLLSIQMAQAESPSIETNTTRIESSGNILQWGIPLVGWGLTFLLVRDNDNSDEWASRYTDEIGSPGVNWPGPRLHSSPRHDFLVSLLRTEVTTYALKYVVNAKRPNGGKQSFPSGHTAAAFMGAEFIRKNYGVGWGFPAYAAASWVGYSRVESNKHYTRDVIAGALIGIVANYDLDKIETPLGQLTIGPTFISINQHAEGCSINNSPRCFKGTPALAPGLQITLGF
ncbi:MAG: phosphatase PAP2 family protein [Steroidobacteraceae bacterium]